MNWEELEREFVSEGWGNGSLHPYAVRDAINFWDSDTDNNSLYVGFDFHWTDWEALFFTALNAARCDEYVEGEDIEHYDARNRRKFEESISDYPLLGRIFDMYEDAVYEAGEVNLLREECLTVRESTGHEGARRASNKLILACNKAYESGFGLRLISD